MNWVEDNLRPLSSAVDRVLDERRIPARRSSSARAPGEATRALTCRCVKHGRCHSCMERDGLYRRLR